MAVLDASAFAMMSALRDQIVSRIAMSEDFRAFVALTRELSAYEALRGSAVSNAATTRRSDGRTPPRIVHSDRL